MNYFEEINQSEVSRTSELLPEALRKDSHVLIGLLEEYYRYMSTVDLPSHILNTLDENYCIDEISEEYLPKIKHYIAPYVPNSSVITTRQLYTKIVKYFYNARGSRESALVFFKIFFGKTDTEIFDFSKIGQSGIVSDKWIPYTYGIKTDIPLAEWEIPYRSLIHPVGFRFFAYLLFVFYSQNHYDLTAAAKEISESSIKVTEVEKYFCFKTSEENNLTDYSLLSPEDNPLSNPLRISDYGYSSHSPTYQPGWFETSIRKLFFFFTNGTYPFTERTEDGKASAGTYYESSLEALRAEGIEGVNLSYEQISQISFILLQHLYVSDKHHLQNLRDEYLGDNKFRDPSVIGSFMNNKIQDTEDKSYVIRDAITPTWNPDNPAQFQNVGSYILTTSYLIVSGAGSSDVNGTYKDLGFDALNPAYRIYQKLNVTVSNPMAYIYRDTITLKWEIDRGTGKPRYASGVNVEVPYGATFFVDEHGVPSPPTVSLLLSKP